MNKAIRSTALIAVCVLATAAKKEQPPIDPGPQPDITEFRAKGERAILTGFYDPSSAQIEWTHGIVGGFFKPVLSRKFPGWWTCGQVNGKNRMGGYVGARSFVVVMNNGEVTFSAVAEGGNYDFIEIQCQQAIGKGILPAPETIEVAAPVALPSLGLAPLLGFTYRNEDDAIIVNEVSPGGIAATATLTPMSAIEKVNGLSLAGLPPETRAKLLDNAGAGAMLTVRGRGDLKMQPPAPDPTAPTAPAPRPRVVRRTK